MMQRISRSLRHEEDGFTLIELLVVVIIIGILAAVAIPVFLNQRQRGWRGAVQSDLRNYAILAETHLTDTGEYTGLATAFPPDDSESDGVQLSVPTANTTTYCLQGEHDNNLGEIWSLTPGGGLTQAACAP